MRVRRRGRSVSRWTRTCNPRSRPVTRSPSPCRMAAPRRARSPRWARSPPPRQTTPADPTATGSLDQAPVLVAITERIVHNVLAVPVNALLALAGGGYAVEVANADGPRHLVPVSPGLFDDAAGLVQVTGSGLAAGQHVVVPAS